MARWSHVLILAFLAAGIGAKSASTQPGAASPAREQLSFTVFLRGTALGGEQATIERTSDGWTVSSSGSLSPPLSLTLRVAELKYDAEWRPRSLKMQGLARETGFDVSVTIGGDRAAVISTLGTNSSSKTDTLSPGAILLPNNFWGAYFALGRTLARLEPGASLRVYVAPQAEIGATLDAVEPDRLRTPERVFDVRRHKVTFQNPGGPLPVEVWTEADGRLVRISIPSAALDIVRADAASIATRQEKVTRAGDEDVKILANGFSLAGTVSRPTPPSWRPPLTKWPALVLVAGSGQLDRDEFVAGIPIFGQLAGALADAGYLVVRYDKRGVGQSGGRAETVTLADYAEDLQAVVRYLDGRKDVDDDRITVVGHSEGAWVGLLAAARDDRISRLVMSAGPATTGNDLVLEQQRYILERAQTPSHEVEAKVALQKRINSAVMFGTSWEGVTPSLRKQAESPWFASFLRFDPSVTMKKVDQPLLIVQGTLDRQVQAHHADKLAALARARKKDPGTDVVKIEGVNHLFVPATTGDVSEYATLATKQISPEWPKAILDWLGKAPAPR
jgi:hypothetical protein